MKLEFLKMLSTKLIICVQQLRMLSGNGTVSTLKLKGCPIELSKVFQEKYGDLLRQPNNISNETWGNMKEYLANYHQSPMLVDAVIMDTLALKNCVDGAVSYYNFLKTNNYNITTPVLLKYLELYSLKEPLSQTEKAYIYTTCKNLMEKYTLLDDNSATSIIRIFCRIDEWEHAIKILESFGKNDTIFLRAGYSSIIEYLYLHGDTELGFEYLTKSMTNGRGPTNETYIVYLEYCMKDKRTFNENVEKLFHLWSKYGTKPTKNVISKYMTACNTFGWDATFTTISRLTCKKCKQKLSNKFLTEMETYRLLPLIKESLLTNMYSATQPKEIEKFVAFIEAKKPFDMIIDVLNVIYCVDGGYKLLKRFLELCISRGSKILLIGRIHLRKQLTSLNLNGLIDCFLVENGSNDDLFLLYAALSSGPKCKVISEDLMRNHKFALGDAELNTLFYKWQKSQQWYINTNLTISRYMSGECIVDKGNNCWHIPYVRSHTQSAKKCVIDTDWACFNVG